MKKLTYLLIIFTLLFSSCNKKDNKKFIANENITDLLNNAKKFKYNRKERINFLDKVYSSLENKKYDKALRNNYYNLAELYFKNKEKEKQLKTYRKILQRADYSNDYDGIIKSNCFIGSYYFAEFINDSAFYYFSKAEKISKKTKEMPYMTSILQNKADLFWCQKDFAGAEATATKALKSAVSKQYKDMMYYSFINIANSLVGMKNYSKALQYYEKAIDQINYLESKNQKIICKITTRNYIAQVYSKQRLYQKSISYLRHNVKFSEIKKIDIKTYLYVINTIAYSKFKLNDKSALSLFKEVEHIADSIQFIPTQVEVKTNLGEYYLTYKDSIKANYYLKSAQKQAHQNNIFEDELKILKLLEKANPRKGSFYSNRYIELNDSLQTVERATRDKFARIEFETDEISSEKEVVSKENSLLYTRIWIISVFALLGLLVIVLWFMNKSQKAQTRELLLKQEQQKTNEEIYQLMINQQQQIEEGKNIEKQRISLELHDGVMGKLSAVRLNLYAALCKANLIEDQLFAKQIDEIQAVEEEIRTIAHDLNSKLFSDNANFVGIVKELFVKIENHSQIHFTLQVSDAVNWDKVNNHIKISLFRILQEALQNIEKYADAKNVAVLMSKSDENELLITISDDGNGFDATQKKDGIGLKNMKTRTAELKGKITIETAPQKGTKINLIIPF